MKSRGIAIEIISCRVLDLKTQVGKALLRGGSPSKMMMRSGRYGRSILVPCILALFTLRSVTAQNGVLTHSELVLDNPITGTESSVSYTFETNSTLYANDIITLGIPYFALGNLATATMSGCGSTTFDTFKSCSVASTCELNLILKTATLGFGQRWPETHATHHLPIYFLLAFLIKIMFKYKLLRI